MSAVMRMGAVNITAEIPQARFCKCLYIHPHITFRLHGKFLTLLHGRLVKCYF